MNWMFYFELDFFCLCIIMTLFLRVFRAGDKQNSQRILIALMISVMALCISDTLWVALESITPVKWTGLKYAVDIVYYVLSGFVSYLWFLYSEYLQESRLVNSKRRKLLGALPVTVFNVLTLTTPWTRLMFYIDENGIFHYGALYILQSAVLFGYIVFTSGKAFLRAQNKEDYANRSKYLTISSFCIFPLICGIWQMQSGSSPVLSMGITLALLQVYINLQSEKISIDPLTQLNNRNQLLRYLSGKMKSPNPDKKLYLLMMDMDYFKKINDQYGHIEGDKALIRVAVALKKVCSRYRSFVCRYGGDEFIIICETSVEEKIRSLCEELNEQLAQENEAAGAPYFLHLSIGYAAYTSEMKTIPDFIHEADKMLYEVKRARKN